MDRCNYQTNQYKITIGIIFLILAYLDLTIFNRDFNIFG